MRQTKSPPVNGLLERWAYFVARRRGTVLLAGAGALVVLIVLWRTMGGAFSNSFSLPGTESQRAFDLLKTRFPAQAGDSANLVFKAPAGVNDPATRTRIEALLARVPQEVPGVIAVVSPYAQDSRAVSRDGQIAYATLQYAVRATNVGKANVDKLFTFVNHAGSPGLTVEVGGAVVQGNEQDPPGATEGIGVLAAIVILLIAFGSAVAMGLPLITAIVGLVASFALMGLGANVLDLPVFSSSFAAMIGLGVGIDYALLIVTRFRTGLHAGLSVPRSLALAMNTAGRAVVFAGTAVMIAMLGMLTNGIPFVGALGIAGAIVVLMAVIVAVTVLPALLAYAGHRIDRWRVPLLHSTETDSTTSFWYRFAQRIQRQPLLWFAGALGALLVLAIPVLSMRLGSSDSGNSPTSLHSRRAYDLLGEGFGKGFNGPFLMVFDLKGAGADAQQRLSALHDALAATPGVAQVSPAALNSGGDAAIMNLVPTTAPQDKATQQLVHELRDRRLPAVVGGSGIRVYVSGSTAAFIDIGDRVVSRLPLFFGAVIGLSFILLTLVFRSFVVSLKAAIMNLLSIGAAYGVIVAVFQWGWFAGALGVKTGPIESFLPMMLFAILFGLSMDYEVFLISRIREEYVQTRDNAGAVAHGLAATARVITAAAAIMVVVFLSFVLGPNRVIKEFGLGLATAIFIDATVVRLALVPAAMELLGDANWWLPGWLERRLPHLDLEGEPALGVSAAD